MVEIEDNIYSYLIQIIIGYSKCYDDSFKNAILND